MSNLPTRIIITEPASIESFNRGPIPTAFAAPTSCLSTLTSGSRFYFGHDAGSYLDTACYPAATSANAIATSWDLYYYSPAISCPSGWSTAETITNSVFGGFRDTFLSVGPGTTAALCCPSGYNAVQFNHQCQSSFPAGVNTILYKQPSLGINGYWDLSISSATTVHNVTTIGTWTVFGDGIPIWYQSSDQVAFMASKTSSASPSRASLSDGLPTSSASVSKATISDAAQTSSAIPSPARASDGPLTRPIMSLSSTVPNSTSLSVGAKAGIAVGVALAVAIVAAIVGLFIFKRKRKWQVASSNASLNDYPYSNKAELDGHDLQPIRELCTNKRESGAIDSKGMEIDSHEMSA